MSPLGRDGVGAVGTDGSDLVRRGTVGWTIVRRLRTPALLTFALAALALLARSGATVSLDVPLAETIGEWRTNVVRHRDGRVAYCKLCRNARRRQRYEHDPAFAKRERARQRKMRRSARS